VSEFHSVLEALKAREPEEERILRSKVLRGIASAEEASRFLKKCSKVRPGGPKPGLKKRDPAPFKVFRRMRVRMVQKKRKSKVRKVRAAKKKPRGPEDAEAHFGGEVARRQEAAARQAARRAHKAAAPKAA